MPTNPYPDPNRPSYVPAGTGSGSSYPPDPNRPSYVPGPTTTRAPWLPPAANASNTQFTGSDPMSRFNMPGFDERNDFTRGQMEGAHNRGMRGAFTSSNSSPFRGYQNDLAARLSRQVNGEESLSQLALRNSTNQNLAQQRSMAASAAPGNVAMAQRLAQQGAGSINQGYGQQAAMLGIQERNAAANALAGLSTNARGQDLQNNQFNAAAQLQNRGQNDQYALGMGGLNIANATGQQRGGMGYEANQTQRYGIDAGKPKEPSWWEKALGYGLQAAPLVAMAMADGGVVTKPTPALVGEAGPEAIVPLNDLINGTQRNQHGVSDIQALDQSNEDEAKKREDFLRALSGGMGSPTDPIAHGIQGGINNYLTMNAIKQAHSQQGSTQSGLLSQLKKPSASGASAGMQPMIRPPTLMATGGIVDHPTHTILGEAGPEAVIPLEKLPGLVQRLTQGIHGDVSQPVAQTRSRQPVAPQPRRIYHAEHSRDEAAEFPFVQQARDERELAAAQEQLRRVREANQVRPGYDWLSR